MKAMILAAGLGTRLKPLTDNTPKALVKIKDKTLLEYVINSLKNQGINEIIINVHHYAQQIIDFIETHGKFNIRIEYSVEPELLGTGGGLKQAGWFFDDHSPFVVYNVDVVSNLDLKKMLSYHRESNALVTLAVRSRKTARYFLFDHTDRLSGWENIDTGEKHIVKNSRKDFKQLSFMGIHIISPEIFRFFPASKKFSIINFYLNIATKNLIKGFHSDSYTWVDCGKLENFQKVKDIV